MSGPAASPSFFVGGGTMKPTAPSYVERPADQEFFERLMAGEFCFVLTSRQMGKSSLIARTAGKLRETGALAANVDLTSIGESGAQNQPAAAATWYYGIARAIARDLGLKGDLKSWWQQRDGLPEMQRFTEFLEDIVLGETGDRRVVIFVDEIDATLRLRFTDDFFAGIRACYNARAGKPAFERLAFALLGVATPSELIKDTARTPFNIGRRIELNDFTLEQAAPLAEGLPLEPGTARQALARVLHWTGGQPYLTQRLCLELSRRLNRPEPIDPKESGEVPPGFGVRQSSAALEGGGSIEKRQSTGALQDAAAPVQSPSPAAATRVDELVQELLFSPEGLRDEVHFKYIRDRLQHDPRRTQVLGTYRRVLRGLPVKDNPQSLPQNALTLAGLVRRVPGGLLEKRNQVYERVFGLDWVRKELAADPTRRRAFAVGAAVILLLALPLGLWYRGGSEEARAQARVEALLGARIEAVPDAIANLRPLQARATPLLRAGFERAEARSASQLNAALGLAAFGDLAPLQAMTRRDPNPSSRTAFIHAYRQWSSDPLRLVDVLQSLAGNTNTNILVADFRSAVCAAFALAAWKGLRGSDQQALLNAMRQTYTEAADAGSHGAALCALTRWGQAVPDLPGSTNLPPPDRDWFVNGLGMTMIRVPAGTFQMGGTNTIEIGTNRYVLGGAIHEVTLTKPFFLSDREVTVALFRQFTNQAALDPTIPPLERLTDWPGEARQFSPTPDCPVQQVSWYDAVKFCNWLSRHEGRAPCYRALNATNWQCDLEATGYRLATEAEWEYACQAVSQARFAFGDDDKLLADYAWYSVNSQNRTWPAGAKLPNLWGLFDLHGNLWEWCQDWYGKDYYQQSPKANPPGPENGDYFDFGDYKGPVRVVRGGSWVSVSPSRLSGSFRSRDRPESRSDRYGFRCVLGGVGSARR